MKRTYFVSGIDTDVGKTVATGMMCRYLQQRGIDWISVKMVQTGCDGFSEDLDRHRQIAGVGLFPEDSAGLTAPQIFSFPSSPLLAARLEGKTVDLRKISDSVRACAQAHDIVLVEGAGGLCVPLTDETLAIDFAASEGWPIILVANGRLGSINHILLSLEAARARNMELTGVVYNAFPATDPVIFADTEATVRHHLRQMGYRDVWTVISNLADNANPDFSSFFKP
jgi:dethiobiotin synthase